MSNATEGSEVDQTDEEVWFTSATTISKSSDNGTAEIETQFDAVSPIVCEMLDGAIQFKCSSDVHDIKVGHFESPDEIRRVADFLHKQADLMEDWIAEEERFLEEHDIDSKDTDWIQENYPFAEKYWREQTE
jgi:hypothetical protein